MSFDQFSSTSDYIASPELIDSVNVAIALQRPLLLKGEPGTGKTRLAEAIASSLQTDLIVWNVKSTTKAQDGLYVYDTVARLNDARFGDRDVRDISAYIKMGPLGQAFKATDRKVVLVDEIDKADIEFPNDLLHELDRMEFVVSETGERVAASKRPVMLITSNNEKELPDAFLRRCVFHWLTFPTPEQMRAIVAVHHPNLDELLLDEVLRRFYWLREQSELRKKPSTSELVDWIAALRRAAISAEKVHAQLPFLGVLLKNERDLDSVRKARPRAW